ncbi:GAF and ANTAR domain-containing protein [Streptomyces venezuelae]|uniref:GAF and ANTAR domain-containing protein n=1 Tax=Streptomyces venezuelae TaxID=54571 RepID=UPI0034551FF6
MDPTDRDAAAGSAPTPEDALDTFLTRAQRAVRTGDGPGTTIPRGAAGLLDLDALTLNMLALGDHLELLWSDPAEGLGPVLDNLQYTLGDGPALDAARQARTLAEPDLSAVDQARWPLFLPAADKIPVRAVIAVPLSLGAATIGVLTGYRTTPGPLTPVQLHGLHRLGRIMLHLLHNELTGTGADTDASGSVRLYRAEVHQATGFLANELGITMGQALLRLRAHAAAHDQPLTDLARGLLDRRLPPDALTGRR